jgi:hypothetical protein
MNEDSFSFYSLIPILSRKNLGQAAHKGPTLNTTGGIIGGTRFSWALQRRRNSDIDAINHKIFLTGLE